MVFIKSKKAVMGLAVILIFMYHFYVPFTQSSLEALIYRTGYIAVDYFIFCSGRSLGSKGTIQFRPFLKNRLLSVYLPFCIFTAIATICKSWSIRRFVEIIFGIKLFTTGGNAFLWYFPAAMLIYLAVPLLSQIKYKYGYKGFFGALVFWLFGAVVMQYVFCYTKIFVMWNRLPLFFIGFWWNVPDNYTKEKPWIALIGTIVGLFLVAGFCWESRLNVLLKDIYFIICGFLVISVSQGFEWLYLTGKKLSILEWLGGISGAMYGFQMTFGSSLTENFTALTGNGQTAFVLSFLATIGISAAFQWIYRKCRSIIPVTDMLKHAAN